MGEIIKTYGTLMNQPTLQLTNPLVKYVILLPLVLFLFFAVHCLKSPPGLRSSHAVAEEIFDYSLVHGKKMEALIAYSSQVSIMFDNCQELRQAFANYSRSLGGAADFFLERYWRMSNNNLCRSSEKSIFRAMNHDG